MGWWGWEWGGCVGVDVDNYKYKHQVRVGTIYCGLRYFSFDKLSLTDATRWDEEPHFALASDQGGDQLSMAMALQYFEPTQCNMTPFYDWTHGVNNDFWKGASDCHLTGFLYLTMIVVNLPHGPDDSDTRYGEVKHNMSQHYIHSNPRLSPLWGSDARQIMAELKPHLVPDEGETLEDCAWRFAEGRNSFKRKGYKCRKARYLQVLASLKELVAFWSLNRFETSVVAIETSAVLKKALPHIKIATIGASSDSAGPDHSTSKSVVGVDERTLRSCGVNAVCIAMAVLSHDGHRRLLCGISHIAGSLLQAHKDESHNCRSVKGSQKWFLEQVEGKAMDQVLAILDSFNSVEMLEAMGFAWGTSIPEQLSAQEVKVEDELAAELGKFGTSLVKHRLCRTAYYFGYPHRMALCLNPDVARHNTKQFQTDSIIHQNCKAQVRQSRLQQLYLKRSPFNLLTVKQLDFGLKQSHYVPCEKFVKHIEARTSAVISTKVVEDVNNFQKKRFPDYILGISLQATSECFGSHCEFPGAHQSSQV